MSKEIHEILRNAISRSESVKVVEKADDNDSFLVRTLEATRDSGLGTSVMKKNGRRS